MVIEVKKGYTEVQFNNEELLAQFYQAEDKVSFINEQPDFENTIICDNEYLIIKLNDEIVDKMRCKNGELIPIKYSRVYSDHLGKMSPRNIQQEFAFDCEYSFGNPDHRDKRYIAFLRRKD